MGGLTNFPGGISSRGVPVPSGASIPTNKVFFVDSTIGADTGRGSDTSKPFKTLAYAVSRCVADKGDFIYVMPSHAETIIAAAGLAVDKAGVSIIGLGNGDDRPTITFTTATTADIDIDAANVTISNMRFISGIASLAAPIDVNAAGFSLLGCDFYASVATTGVDITVITDAAANDMTIKGCGFNYLTSLATTAVTDTSTEVVRLVGADRAVITDNYFGVNATVSVINGITTASKEVRINDNDIHNIAAGNIAGVVDLVAACTGTINRNQGFIGYSTSLALVIDPSSCSMVQNYFSNVVTEAGGLVGTAST